MQPEPHPESVYRRRRIVVAAGVLLVVALIAWACGGSDGGEPRNTGARGVADVPTGAATPASPVSPASPRPSASTGDAGRATSTADAGASPGAEAEKQTDRARAGTDRGGCRRHDLRVRLSADADSYPRGERPTFEVLVTSGRACTADLGPQALRVVVTSGPDRIWSSGDCATARGDTTRKVSPHLPRERTVTWQRVRSFPDRCDESADPVRARPGWYVAVAKLGRITSDKVVFRLR